MFDPSSRYSKIPTTSLTDASGRQIAYLRRRFLPRSQDLPLLVVVTVAQGDRLDLITARTIGDPEQFWRVCDASSAMNPADLVPPPQGTAAPGMKVRIPIPQPQ